jgi:phosphoglucomutase
VRGICSPAYAKISRRNLQYPAALRRGFFIDLFFNFRLYLAFMDAKLDKALSGMILSASGWRGIFAEDGDEESSGSEISEAHKIIAAAAAKVFSDYLSATVPTDAVPRKSAVIAGMDTRPTGKAVVDAAIRVLRGEGWKVLYTGVAAVPEIMAFARANKEAAGFVYISASHNPIGHNGIKFGLTDGGVLQAGEAAKLASAFRSFMALPGRVGQARILLEKAGPEQIAGTYNDEKKCKAAALADYLDFTAEVISGFKDKAKNGGFFAALRRGLEKRPLGIAADFNGSARAVSIDREFLQSLGAGFYSLNSRPGEIAHRIVPEGGSLDACREFLEELRRKDPSAVLGYMPDCDGDRGNLVIWDEGKKRARALEAQEVFALSCVAELSSLVFTGELRYDDQGKAVTKAALSVNDPTSLRIDKIAGYYGVQVFRAETGEANVVGLARKLRKQGCLVRILGEGSSGGTIIHPSAVRDPVDTLGAIIKLLSIRDGQGEGLAGMGLFKNWCSLSGQAGNYREDFGLADIIASLPAFSTTGAYSEEAVLKVKTADHGVLKDRYQKIFLRDWEAKKEALLKRFGISGWEAIAYNGTEERRGIAKFGEAGRGGLKIEFQGRSACMWMRGSGTEPVFRIMADGEGPDPQLERTLIEWQRQMVLEADNA